MPCMEELIAKLRGKSVFSIIDLKSAYNQVPLNKQSKKFAGLLLPWGTFQLNCLSFGFKNAPAFFQRNMTKRLQPAIDAGYCIVYIDDIVIFSNSFEEHDKHLRHVLDLLAEGNWKATPNKCHFYLKQIKILGKVANATGLTTDPEMVKDIKEFPRPHSKQTVQSFLGLVRSF